jgi:hypothetical protein
MKHNRILPLVLATLVIATACKKDKDDYATTDTAAPTAATPTTDSASSSFDVGDIDMGRHIGADKKISDKTDDFAPTDTIYASIHTKGGTAPVQLTARWTFQDSTVVAEDTQSVQAGVEGDTEFHIVKKGGWPKGKYTVHIMADGKEVKTKEVEVK